MKMVQIKVAKPRKAKKQLLINGQWIIHNILGFLMFKNKRVQAISELFPILDKAQKYMEKEDYSYEDIYSYLYIGKNTNKNYQQISSVKESWLFNYPELEFNGDYKELWKAYKLGIKRISKLLLEHKLTKQTLFKVLNGKC